jgi:uncharacterized protein related to proFAR isomerase
MEHRRLSLLSLSLFTVMTKDRKAELEVIKELRAMGAYAVVVGDIQAQFAPGDPFQTTEQVEPSDDPRQEELDLSPEDFERRQILDRVAEMANS